MARFLHGRYIPDFDPNTDNIPQEDTLERLLYTHNIGFFNTCNFTENRYPMYDFYDKEKKKTYDKIYCWKGVIKQQYGKQCTIGTVCDPNSYAGARTRFCLTWGCDSPHEYVADDEGDPIVNERGGIVVFNPKETCDGAIINKLNCFIGGFRQSLDHVLDPVNRKKLIMQMGILAVVTIIGVIMIVRLRRSKRKGIVRFRNLVKPNFAKTASLFPKRR